MFNQLVTVNIVRHHETKGWRWYGLALVALATLWLVQPVLQLNFGPDQLNVGQDNFIASGFYNPQASEEGFYFDWTAQAASMVFDYPFNYPFDLKLEVRSATVVGGPEAPVKVLVNGRDLGMAQPKTLDSSFQTFSFRVNPQLSEKSLKIELQAQPFQVKGDRRIFGTMIKGITLDRSIGWAPISQRERWLWLLPALLMVSTSFALASLVKRGFSPGLVGVGLNLAGFALSGFFLALLIKTGPVDSLPFLAWLASLIYLVYFFSRQALQTQVKVEGTNRQPFYRWIFELSPASWQTAFRTGAMVLYKASFIPPGKIVEKTPVWPDQRRWKLAWRYALPILMLLLGAYRLSLTDRGALAFPDEKRYHHPRDAMEKLVGGDMVGFAQAISTMDGRPGEGVARLIPAAGQLALSQWLGIAPRNSVSLLVATGYNVIITLVITYLFYRLTFLLFQSQALALLGTVIYSLFANTNLYIRHIFPYDTALAVLLGLLYYTLVNQQTYTWRMPLRVCLIMGVLAGFGFAVYPGYYFFPFLILTLLAMRGDDKVLSLAKFLRYLVFGAGFCLVIAFFEVVARIGRTSYLQTSVDLAGTINQGLFAEGFSFLPEYLLQVENFSGTLLLVLTGAYLVTQVWWAFQNRFRLVRLDNIQLLVLTMAAGWLVHAAGGVFFHLFVFYGRLLHLYFPFLIWAALGVLVRVPGKLQGTAFGIALIMSLVSFALFAVPYYSLAYPRDVLYNQGILLKTEKSTPQIRLVNETLPHQVIPSPPSINNQTGEPYYAQPPLILVNFCYWYPLNLDFTLYHPATGEVKIYLQLHYQSFAPYSYEGYPPEERELFRQRQYQLGIYKQK